MMHDDDIADGRLPAEARTHLPDASDASTYTS